MQFRVNPEGVLRENNPLWFVAMTTPGNRAAGEARYREYAYDLALDSLESDRTLKYRMEYFIHDYPSI